MLPAKLSLWKKEGSKWYRYSTTFRTADNDSFMQASRLVRFGWIPYPDVKKVTDSSVPLDTSIFDIDTKPLDEAVAAQTPLARQIPKDWYERVIESHREANKKAKPEEDVIEEIEKLSESEEDRLLKRAIEEYKKGVKLPPFLLKKVLRVLF